MKNRPFTIFLLPLILLGQSQTFADDVSKGRDHFLKQCIGCHAFSCNRDSNEAYAPRLGGLFGRKVGGLDDFSGYSEGFKNSQIIWTDETLDEFFKDPGEIDPESIMADKGKIEDAEHRREIIAFLKTEDPTMNLFCP